jgi:hypothetical protein
MYLYAGTLLLLLHRCQQRLAHSASATELLSIDRSVAIAVKRRKDRCNHLSY